LRRRDTRPITIDLGIGACPSLGVSPLRPPPEQPATANPKIVTPTSAARRPHVASEASQTVSFRASALSCSILSLSPMREGCTMTERGAWMSSFFPSSA